MGRRVTVNSVEPGEKKGLPLLGDGSLSFLILRNQFLQFSHQDTTQVPRAATSITMGTTGHLVSPFASWLLGEDNDRYRTGMPPKAAMPFYFSASVFQ
jgi:hypothetical protein